MILLGLVLIIVAAGAAGWLYYLSESMTGRIELDALGVTIGVTPFQLVLAGAAIMLILWLGLLLLRRGMARSARLRRERRENARLAEERRAADEREAEDRLRDERLATQTARERAETAEGEVASLRRETSGADPEDDIWRRRTHT